MLNHAKEKSKDKQRRSKDDLKNADGAAMKERREAGTVRRKDKKYMKKGKKERKGRTEGKNETKKDRIEIGSNVK